jgi:cell division protein ZapE
MHGDQLHAQDLCTAQFSAEEWSRLLQISSMALNSHPCTTPDSISVRYTARIAAGEIEGDLAQQEIVAGLAALEADLATWRLARKSSSLGWLFGSRARAAIKGRYIYGDVGRGKTMLMDMFFEAAPVMRKRRVHFHEFMAEVHERIHALRQQLKAGEIKDGDPVGLAAEAIAREASLLCFDEFHVTDIADAMILGRLFKRLFELGVVVVATSNIAPEKLYEDGLNRALFLPFIALIEEHMTVVRLAARTDFRLEKLAGASVWHVPADETAAALDEAWRRLTAGRAGEERNLPVLGRIIHVPQAAMGVARFSFRDLCEAPLAAPDYLKIAHEFHTVLLDHVPIMDHGRRNEAKRFIILIDTLYDNAVKLLASAAAEPNALYRADQGSEAHAFKRTASRLIEMRSQGYLARPHGKGHAVAADSTAGLVET